MHKSFIEFFNETAFRVEIVDKRKSFLMRLANLFLALTNKLNITDVENFMTGYITTIGQRIYGTALHGWNEEMLPNGVLLHELTHAAGFRREGFLKYSLKYLFSKKWRAKYESYCVQAELMYNPSLQTQANLERRALHFIPYGIDLITIHKELQARLDEINHNNPHPDARTVVGVYKLWQSAHS